MRRLLIIIDLQNGWRHKTETEAVMLRTVKLCEDFEGDVIHCCYYNDQTSLFNTQLNWHRMVESPDIDQISEIAKLKLPQVWRKTYSIVNNETLALIKKHEPIYIAGVFTDISVAATAMDLFDRDISASVVTDCVATLHGQDVHRAALKSLGHAIGREQLVKSKDIL